jgi:hypothetical protein
MDNANFKRASERLCSGISEAHGGSAGHAGFNGPDARRPVAGQIGTRQKAHAGMTEYQLHLEGV